MKHTALMKDALNKEQIKAISYDVFKWTDDGIKEVTLELKEK
jgi:hypothetical protein